MKNKKILFSMIILSAFFVIILLNCNNSNKSSIQERLSVFVNYPKNDIIKPDKTLEKELKEKIPVGTLLRFSKNGELSIRPDTAGVRGLFFSFAVKTRNKKNIETTILLKRKNDFHLIKRFEKGNYYRKFLKEFSFLKGDEILIRVKGEGTIIINKPLLYKIIKKEKRKYVFLIALDTLRYDSIGSKRNGISLTPAIDALKKDSVVFSNTFSQSSWTLPSFTSFFTGLYEFNHQITRTTSLEKNKPFLIEQLREKFLTVNFNAGLWLKGKFGFSRGFDSFAVISNPKDSFGGRALFNKTIAFVEESRFPSLFMFLHTYQIHAPYAPPEKYKKKLNLKVKKTNIDTYYYNKQYLKDFDKDLPEEMRKLYDAEIFAFDDFFSKFIKSLKDKGIYDQSMIVFFTDHGEEFYEHKAWSHAHSLYNEVIKSPLFIKFPRNQYKGKEIKENAAIIDILPTILDYIKVKHNKKIDGLSLMPLIYDKKWERKNIFSSTSITWLVKQIQPKFAIINENHKIIYNFSFSEKNKLFFSEYGSPPEVEQIQIFDLKRDPEEKQSLEGREKAQIKKRVLQDIRKIRKKIEKGMTKKRKSTISLTDEERRKLESLGYL